jgi:transposase
LHVIGEERSSELEFVPASLFRRERVRVKLGCRRCQDKVIVADAPARPIEKGLAGPGLLSHVLVSKYADHLPLYRLEDIFARHGVKLSRQTMSDWVSQCSALLAPVVTEMARQQMRAPVIHTDDTPVPVLDPGKGRTHRGYMWIYQDDAGNAVFRFTRTRNGSGPAAQLGDYKGYVQADAYSGYHELFEGGKAVEVGCWAHARRRFFDAQLTEPVLAPQALALIGELYRIEHGASALNLDANDRKTLREQKSREVLDRFKSWLDDKSFSVLPKSPLGTAITYARNQWTALTAFLADGRLPLDNNAAERALRPVAIGRKNWLFAGSDKGGHAAATIYSLVYSAKLLGLDPWRYLRDVLELIPKHPMKQIADLTPAGYARILQQRAIAAYKAA